MKKNDKVRYSPPNGRPRTMLYVRKFETETGGVVGTARSGKQS